MNLSGSSEEVGVFEMAGHGLVEVADPGGAFLETESLGAPGGAGAAAPAGRRARPGRGPAIVLPPARPLPPALRDRPLVSGTVTCGEIGLTGELRPIHSLARRLREAARLGLPPADRPPPPRPA